MSYIPQTTSIQNCEEDQGRLPPELHTPLRSNHVLEASAATPAHERTAAAETDQIHRPAYTHDQVLRARRQGNPIMNQPSSQTFHTSRSSRSQDSVGYGVPESLQVPHVEQSQNRKPSLDPGISHGFQRGPAVTPTHQHSRTSPYIHPGDLVSYSPGPRIEGGFVIITLIQCEQSCPI